MFNNYIYNNIYIDLEKLFVYFDFVNLNFVTNVKMMQDVQKMHKIKKTISKSFHTNS